MKTIIYTHAEAIKIASVAHAQGWNGRGVFSFSDNSRAKMWETLKELNLLNKNAPEEPELITSEALEKGPEWVFNDLLKQYGNGSVVVEFYTSSGFEVLIDGDLERVNAKGVTTMPELRLLATLINGKA